MIRSQVPAALAAVFLLGVMPASGDVVIEWNAIMQSAVSGQNPFAQARSAAIAQIAVFEAVNAITLEYEPYLGTIEGPAGASTDAAAIAAAHRVLKTLFPLNTTIDDARAASLAAIPDSPQKEQGVAVGEAAATAILARRSADGSGSPQAHQPQGSSPGEWQLTPTCSAGILLHWRNVTPFALESSAQFRSAPAPALTSRRYTKDFDEVKAVGGMTSALRPPGRADVARFYAAVLAVAAWNDAVRQIAAARAGTLTANARVFALLNIAISDALVSVMETKYHYRFWRPVTAIAAAAQDGNDGTSPDPLPFEPYVTTPCFPGYPSAHASASYAAATVLQRLFDVGGHDITLQSAAVPNVTLRYATLHEMTRDIDDARVYGGIHFRFDQDAGARQGFEIGRYVEKTLMRPRP